MHPKTAVQEVSPVVLSSTNISFHPCTLESSDKIVDVYESQSSQVFSGIDVVFSHPLSISFTQDVLVDDFLYCSGISV